MAAVYSANGVGAIIGARSPSDVFGQVCDALRANGGSVCFVSLDSLPGSAAAEFVTPIQGRAISSATAGRKSIRGGVPARLSSRSAQALEPPWSNERADWIGLDFVNRIGRYKMVYAKGKPDYELVATEEHVYVLQVDEERFPRLSLPHLGEQLKQLPNGWTFRTRILAEGLALDLHSDKTIYAVGDEFHQYYTRIANGK
jgi:hypothetical protein